MLTVNETYVMNAIEQKEEDDYFSSRQQHDSPVLRIVFDAAFKRGWKAAVKETAKNVK